MDSWPDYYGVNSGEEYRISGPRGDGADRLYGERVPVTVRSAEGEMGSWRGSNPPQPPGGAGAAGRRGRRLFGDRRSLHRVTTSAADAGSSTPTNGAADEFADAARRLHKPMDAVHVVGYFAPETTQAYLDLGLTDYGMGYFASRSAPMGAVAAEVTIATFYVFSPALVAAYLPKAWDIATPSEVTEARYRGIEAALRRGLADAADSDEVARAAELAKAAVAGLETTAGRALCAAHARLPWPGSPLMDLWLAASILREHRGDGHVAALVLAGLDPVESLVTAGAAGGPLKFLRATRGWSDEQWEAGEARLRDRGLLADDGCLTPAGAALRDEVEANTDKAAAAPYRSLGAEGAQELRDLLRPLARRIVDAGILPRSVAGKP